MIKVGTKYQITRDKYQWILGEVQPCKTKDGDPSTKIASTYHASIEQVCANIINRELGECGSMVEVLDWLKNAKSVLVQKVEDADNG